MMRMISVIIPIYNMELYLVRCLESVIAQTIFEQIEIILVDDGSKDTSAGICDEYAAKYENIIALHKSNGGVSSARNKGLEIASGKYLGYIDADDYIAPDMYELLLSAITQEKADIAIADFYVCFPDGTKIKKRKTNGRFSWTGEEAVSALLSGKQIGINIFDKIFLREKVNNIHFIEGKSIGEDMYYIFECLLHADKIYADFSGKYFYEKREGSAMKSSFSDKYLDTLYFSELMIHDTERMFPQLVPFAKAHLVHEQCKTLERMYLLSADSQYEEHKKRIERKIKGYQLKEAYRYLSKKQFCGILIMKISPRLYIKLLKIMKIE